LPAGLRTTEGRRILNSELKRNCKNLHGRFEGEKKRIGEKTDNMQPVLGTKGSLKRTCLTLDKLGKTNQNKNSKP